MENNGHRSRWRSLSVLLLAPEGIVRWLIASLLTSSSHLNDPKVQLKRSSLYVHKILLSKAQVLSFFWETGFYIFFTVGGPEKRGAAVSRIRTVKEATKLERWLFDLGEQLSLRKEQVEDLISDDDGEPLALKVVCYFSRLRLPLHIWMIITLKGSNLRLFYDKFSFMDK